MRLKAELRRATSEKQLYADQLARISSLEKERLLLEGRVQTLSETVNREKETNASLVVQVKNLESELEAERASIKLLNDEIARLQQAELLRSGTCSTATLSGTWNSSFCRQLHQSRSSVRSVHSSTLFMTRTQRCTKRRKRH